MAVKNSLIAVALLALPATSAACGGSSTPSFSGPPAASSAPTVATCEGAHLGQTGVISLQCNGTATIKVTTGSVSKQLTGGICMASAGLFVVNAGVVTDHTFVGARPDFVSVNTPAAGGGGEDTGASILLDGKFYGDSGRFGGSTVFTADHRGLTFTGLATDGETATIGVSGC